MKKMECIYQKYTEEFRCNYYLVESTKKFIKTGDKIKAFDIKIERVLANGTVLDTINLANVGINKKDVIEQVREGQVDI